MDEQLYDSIISSYLKNWAAPLELILNNNDTREWEHLDSLKENVWTKAGVLLANYQFIGSIPSKLKDVDGSNYWYYPEARLCKKITYSEDSAFILSFYLQNVPKNTNIDLISKNSKINKKQLYGYQVKIDNPVTFLNSETYGMYWWYLDCDIDKVGILKL